ncbi:MAG TPA: transporter substrate-binding domain-containing protein [Actinomycetota bacterium]|nr:transporter substrate-binding domain-containing protein [Actinomycetota bacterium]
MRLPLAAAVLCAALAACVPPVPSDDRRIAYEDDTVMGIVQDAGTLRVGLEEAAPLSFGVDDSPRGFVVALAEDLAASLGVDAEYVWGSTDELLAMVAEGDADVAFPLTPITERAVREHAFTDPYLVVHQRIAAPEDAGVESVADLDGRSVCAVVEPSTEADVAQIAPDARVEVASDVAACADALRSGRADAAVATDALLLAIVHADDSVALTGDELSTAGYGAVVAPGTASWRDYVSNVAWEAKDEGRWTRWYEQWIAPYVDDPRPAPPKMTLEEAAALFPVDHED